MKIRYFALIALAALPLVGCSSSRTENAGGTSDPYGIGTSTAEGNPQPSASPTFRPGMNPQDPRDPHFITRPQPFQQPPATR